MAEYLRGAAVAASLSAALSARANALKSAGTVPTLAILRVGARPEDLSYEASAIKRCEQVGISVQRFLLPQDCTRETLLDTLRTINENPTIHGCLMFRPLADQGAEDAACALLAPAKDIDGMTPGSQASVFTGRGPGFPPCTAQACMEILDYYGIRLPGKRAVVVGRSSVVGKPVSMMLQKRNATVTMCHTGTMDLASECRRAEVLVAAAGKAGIIGCDHVSPGQVVIDVGINVNDAGALCGDVDFPSAEPIVAAITPVPGGVGAVTTAVLCKHVVEAAERVTDL